jgi:hypothetical protein
MLDSFKEYTVGKVFVDIPLELKPEENGMPVSHS